MYQNLAEQRGTFTHTRTSERYNVAAEQALNIEIPASKGVEMLHQEVALPNTIHGQVVRWGRRYDRQRRLDEMAHTVDPTLIAQIKDVDFGVTTQYLNALPEHEAEGIERNIVLGMADRHLRVLRDSFGISSDNVDGVWLGSSVPLRDGDNYAQFVARELGLRKDIKTKEINAACTSGMWALMEALSQDGGIHLVIGVEGMSRLVAGVDLSQIDLLSSMVFSQAAASLTVMPGRNMSSIEPNINGRRYYQQEYPDTTSSLGANLGEAFINSVPFGAKIVYEDSGLIRVKYPTPNTPGRKIDMAPEAGVTFTNNMLAFAQHVSEKIPRAEWDKIMALLMHFPSKTVANGGIRKMIDAGLMPQTILDTYYKSIKNGTSISNQELARQIKKAPNGLVDFATLPVYPKENPYGNPPAANALIALINKLDDFSINEVLAFILAFGAGQTFVGARVQF